MLNDTSTISDSPVLRKACTTPGRYGQSPDLPCRHVEIANRASFLETDQARTHDSGGFDRRSMCMVAAHLVGLGEHDMDVSLVRQFGVRQGLEEAPACIACVFTGSTVTREVFGVFILPIIAERRR